jgi:hypothetical protein
MKEEEGLTRMVDLATHLYLDWFPWQLTKHRYELQFFHQNYPSWPRDHSRIDDTQPTTSNDHCLPLPATHISTEIGQPSQNRADPE